MRAKALFKVIHRSSGLILVSTLAFLLSLGPIENALYWDPLFLYSLFLLYHSGEYGMFLLNSWDHRREVEKVGIFYGTGIFYFAIITLFAVMSTLTLYVVFLHRITGHFSSFEITIVATYIIAIFVFFVVCVYHFLWTRKEKCEKKTATSK